MPRKVRFAINGVRDLARDRVEKTSLRAVAAEIGMSNSGLFSFLRGGEPYSPVRKKLVAWFIRTNHSGAKLIRDIEIDAAVSVLAAYLRQSDPEHARDNRFLMISERIAGEGAVGSGEQIPDQYVAVEYATTKRRREGKRARR